MLYVHTLSSVQQMLDGDDDDDDNYYYYMYKMLSC